MDSIWILATPWYHLLMLVIVVLFIWRVERWFKRIERKVKRNDEDQTRS